MHLSSSASVYTGFIKWEWVIHQSYAYHENTQRSMDVVQTEALPTPTAQQYRTNELPQVYCLSLILNRFTQYISLGLCFISMSARRAYSIQNTMDIWNCWANNNTYRHHDVQVFSPTFSAGRGKKIGERVSRQMFRVRIKQLELKLVKPVILDGWNGAIQLTNF